MTTVEPLHPCRCMTCNRRFTVAGGRPTPRGREIVAAFRGGATPTEVCATFGCSRHAARRMVAIAMSETVEAALNLAAVNAAEHQRAKTARFVDARRLARILAVGR